MDVVPNLLLILCLVVYEQLGGLRIQRILGVGVEKQLRQEYFENIDKIIHWRPRLIYDVQAHGARPDLNKKWSKLR